MKQLCVLMCAALMSPAGSAFAAPQKVVSLNLCTDQLALSMLTPAQLKGVSFNAADPALSLVAGVAVEYPQLKGSMEEMASIQPDMVLLGKGQNPQLQRWLKDKSIPFIALPHANSIEQVQQQVAEVAAALGHEDYALNLRARQNVVIGQSKLPQRNMRVAMYYPRGFTDGRGTLIHELISRMGGRNVAAEQGEKGMKYLSLEELVAKQPDVLIIPLYEYDVISQAEKLSQHPALKGMKAHVVPLPGQYLTCPHLGLEAVANTISMMVKDSIDSAAARKDEQRNQRTAGSKPAEEGE